MTSDQKRLIIECLGMAESVVIGLKKYLDKADNVSQDVAEIDEIYLKILAHELHGAESTVDIVAYQ